MFLIAKNKKPHTISEELPCAKVLVEKLFGEKESEKLNIVSLANNTVHRRIVDMSADVTEQIVKQNQVFSKFCHTTG